MNSNLDIEIPAFGNKPHTVGWLVAAIICSIPPMALAAFVYSEWRDVNEFTLMVTMIPALLALLLGFAALILWMAWIFQIIRSRKYTKHFVTLHKIADDLRREQAETRATAKDHSAH